MNDEKVIEIEGLSKSFGDIKAWQEPIICLSGVCKKL